MDFTKFGDKCVNDLDLLAGYVVGACTGKIHAGGSAHTSPPVRLDHLFVTCHFCISCRVWTVCVSFDGSHLEFQFWKAAPMIHWAKPKNDFIFEIKFGWQVIPNWLVLEATRELSLLCCGSTSMIPAAKL